MQQETKKEGAGRPRGITRDKIYPLLSDSTAGPAWNGCSMCNWRQSSGAPQSVRNSNPPLTESDCLTKSTPCNMMTQILLAYKCYTGAITPGNGQKISLVLNVHILPYGCPSNINHLSTEKYENHNIHGTHSSLLWNMNPHLFHFNNLFAVSLPFNLPKLPDDKFCRSWTGSQILATIWPWKKLLHKTMLSASKTAIGQIEVKLHFLLIYVLKLTRDNLWMAYCLWHQFAISNRIWDLACSWWRSDHVVT